MEDLLDKAYNEGYAKGKNEHYYSIAFRENAGAFFYYSHISDKSFLVIYFKNYGNNQFSDYFSDIEFMKNRVKSLLAGKASTEVVFNKCDVGANSDLHRAYGIVRML